MFRLKSGHVPEDSKIVAGDVCLWATILEILPMENGVLCVAIQKCLNCWVRGVPAKFRRPKPKELVQDAMLWIVELLKGLSDIVWGWRGGKWKNVQVVRATMAQFLKHFVLFGLARYLTTC